MNARQTGGAYRWISGWIAVLTAAAATVTAQDIGNSGVGSGGLRGGGCGRPPPPNSAQLATNLMAQFDANGNNALSVDELTEALTDRQKHRPPPPRFESEAENDAQDQPLASEIAAEWIDLYAADETTGLTVDELTQALEATRPPHGPPGNAESVSPPVP